MFETLRDRNYYHTGTFQIVIDYVLMYTVCEGRKFRFEKVTVILLYEWPLRVASFKPMHKQTNHSIRVILLKR